MTARTREKSIATTLGRTWRRAESEHSPSIFTVLLVRRWRQSRTHVAAMLDRWGVESPLARGWATASMPGLGPTRTLTLLFLPGLLAGAGAGIGIGLWAAGLGLPSVPLGLALALLLGLLSGVGDWRRTGDFAFSELARLTPASEADLARISVAAALTWQLPAALLLTSATATGALAAESAQNILPAVLTGAMAASATLATYTAAHVCGVALRLRQSHRTTEHPFHPALFLQRVVRTITAFAVGHLITTALVTFPARTLSAIFQHPHDFLDNERWDLASTILIEDLLKTVDFIIVQLPIQGFIPLVLVSILVVAAAGCIIAVPPPLLSARADAVPLPWPRSVRWWVDRQFLPDAANSGVIAARRAQSHPWATGHVAWRTVFPPSEALALLGATNALLSLERPTAVHVAVVVTAAIMVGHVLAADLRIESAPLHSLAHERTVVPLLLQARTRGALTTLAERRIAALERHMRVPTGVLAVAALAIALVHGLHTWVAGVAALSVLLAAWTGARLQWYTAPLLLAETRSLRETELADEGLTAMIQSQGQAWPRTALVVVPSFVAAGSYLMPGLVHGGVLTAVLVVTMLGHVLTVAALPAVTSWFADKALDAGLDGWQTR